MLSPRRGSVAAPFELSVECAPIKPEHLGSQRLVAADCIEHPQYVASLDLLHWQELSWIAALDRDSRALELAYPFGQIVEPELIILRESDRALDTVL